MQQLSLFSLSMPAKNLGVVKVPQKVKTQKNSVSGYIQQLVIDFVDSAKRAVSKSNGAKKHLSATFVPGIIENDNKKTTYSQPITGCCIVFYRNASRLTYFYPREAPYSIDNADEADFDYWVKEEEKEAKRLIVFS